MAERIINVGDRFVQKDGKGIVILDPYDAGSPNVAAVFYYNAKVNETEELRVGFTGTYDIRDIDWEKPQGTFSAEEIAIGMGNRERARGVNPKEGKYLEDLHENFQL